jgi:hypothetical protein
MRKALLVALCLPLVACVVGSEGNGGPGGDDGGGSGSNPGSGSNDTGISGSIAADQTWTGATRLKGAVTIEAGATVTVDAGAALTFANGAGITIKGALKINGTKAAKVTMEPEAPATAFGDLRVSGTLEMTYAVNKGGAFSSEPGSTTTITDTHLSNASGDFMKPGGGTITVSYSQIGIDKPAVDSTHCNIHTSGDLQLSITNSNITGVPYGIMLYAGKAILTNNNWYDNGVDVDTSGATAGVTGDVSGSWFDGTPPVATNGAVITKNNIAATKLIDAGVR